MTFQEKKSRSTSDFVLHGFPHKWASKCILHPFCYHFKNSSTCLEKTDLLFGYIIINCQVKLEADFQREYSELHIRHLNRISPLNRSALIFLLKLWLTTGHEMLFLHLTVSLPSISIRVQSWVAKAVAGLWRKIFQVFMFFFLFFPSSIGESSMKSKANEKQK